MILKFGKELNENKEFTLISLNLYDNIDGISLDKFTENNCNIYQTAEYCYFYVKNIINLGDCEKFKIKVKKGDIVSLTARDNSYMVFPSKKSFAFAFNLNYNSVLSYKYVEVLRAGKPYEVKYVKDSDEIVDDGVVYTLSQLVSYVSELIKGYNYRETERIYKNKENELLNRVIAKRYNSYRIETDKKYELNIKKTGLDENNKWFSTTIVNITKSNRYLYDYYLLRMFAYMILTKSLIDDEKCSDDIYRFDRKFNNIEEVYLFLEENQDIVNNFFIETDILFNNPNSMITSYAPPINGVYLYYDYNKYKTYLYRTKDSNFFNSKSLKNTYVSKYYKHKIRGIQSNYTTENSKN